MRLLVCGDRRWQRKGIIRRLLITLAPEVVIEGGCSGADRIAQQIAAELNIPVEEYPANWHKYGKAAGPIRNTQMLLDGKPDRVLAFHDDLSRSKGTKHMVGLARAAKVPVWVSSEG
jgi:hypothetical protein